MWSLPASPQGYMAQMLQQEWRETFTGLRFGLMVGVGGGIPNLPESVDIGDVVISQPGKTYGGVVQYDFGKNLGDKEFERKEFLKPPSYPPLLLCGQIIT
ncbi:hypothetical protein PV08_03419 [Exophiala spinifera]|uniref:Nucleoside phosphorylase domain-containing protein n=1 Tax=Exophiala spinifera TaxID=91928 RepID=A0A0D2A2G1_9EURO|nr:uncharacterized protein PV08_03419 [Exophiala spinifera]KIW19127.1 hypothetical protein PV08_03419 [Exophiala spinifera]